MPATKPTLDHPTDPRRPRRVLTETFHCERRSVDLQMHECMTSYVNANALQQKTSPCFGCALGLEQRTFFAKRG